MLKRILLFIICTITLVGCSATSFKYVDKSVPVKKGVTKYHLEEVNVTLKLGTNGEGKENDTVYASQDELKEQFSNGLKKYLGKYNLLGSNSESLAISASFDFTRNFNFGGKALNIPTFSHEITIKKGNTKVATYNWSNYVIDYNTLRNLKIASFLSDADDEKKDIDLICEEIIEDLSKFGE